MSLIIADYRRKLEDLQARLDALLARPDAQHPGQQDNVEALRSELEAVQDLLYEWGGTDALPGVVPWFAPRRSVRYVIGDDDHRFVKTSTIMVRRVGQEPAQLRRNGRAWQRTITRVRDNYELVVGGTPVAGTLGSRRYVSATANFAHVYGVGTPPVEHLRLALFPDGGPGKMRRRARALYLLRKERRLVRRLARLPRDRCQICRGRKGGRPGNENIIGGRLVCDNCHAEGLA